MKGVVLTPFQPVENVVQVVFHFDRNSVAHKPQIEVYFERDGGWADQDLTALCQFYMDGFDATWGLDAFIWEFGDLTKISARDLSEEFGNFGQVIETIPGTSTAQPSSPNNAALVEFFGATGGAPRRGGVYWPFVTEGGVDAQGNLTTLYTTDLRNALSTMLLASLTAEGPYRQVILSRFHGTDPDTGKPIPRDPVLTKDVTAWITRPIVASQRGRRDRPA